MRAEDIFRDSLDTRFLWVGLDIVTAFIFTLSNMGCFQLLLICLEDEAISVRHSSATLRNIEDEFSLYLVFTGDDTLIIWLLADFHGNS